MLLETLKGTNYTLDLLVTPAAQVTLLNATPEPLTLLSDVERIYHGQSTPLREPSSDIVQKIQSAVLQTPLEMIHTLWHITDVTRAFTHQLVRYRIGVSFAQESQRFALQTHARVLVPKPIADGPISQYHQYVEGVEKAISVYADLVDAGVPVQDARGVLPTNICTTIYFDCNLKTLAHIYGQRAISMAQPGEWPVVVRRFKEELTAYEPAFAELLQPLPYTTQA